MSKEVFKDLWQTLKQKQKWSGKIKNRKKNGEPYYVDTTITPIFGMDENVEEFIAMRHDITELEEYKLLLREELDATNQNFYENINYTKQYESAINNFIGMLKTDTNNIITYANSKFCDLSGYTLDELIGKECVSIRDEKHRENKDCEEIAKELAKKKSVNKLLTNIKKNGEKLYTATLFFPVRDIHGEVIEYLQIMHDISEIINLNQEIVDTQKEVVFTMGAIGEMRSKETGLHVQRVAEYSYLLATLVGLDEVKADLIKQASPMHDIGKVAIPDAILNKPGKLTADEYEIMKTHAYLGYEMLKYSNRTILKTSAVIAHTHHEKYDGSGYPHGLIGENIPIEGRITAIADVFDALGHDRVYKKAWEMDKILDLFREERSKHFDPKLIDLFFENLDKFLEIKNKMGE
jgi:PAS domain S-box-containing protein